MSAGKLAAILAVIINHTSKATVEGEFDHAGFGNTLRVNYNGQKKLDLEAWEADVLDDENVHLFEGHAIIVVN